MILVAFKENEPYSLTEYPFDDMYVTERKFIKVGISNDVWCGILIGDNSDLIGQIEVVDLSEYTDIQSNTPLTKLGVIRRIYSVDQETKILRDAAAGRNMDKFMEYDQFVESIPSV